MIISPSPELRKQQTASSSKFLNTLACLSRLSDLKSTQCCCCFIPTSNAAVVWDGKEQPAYVGRKIKSANALRLRPWMSCASQEPAPDLETFFVVLWVDTGLLLVPTWAERCCCQTLPGDETVRWLILCVLDDAPISKLSLKSKLLLLQFIVLVFPAHVVSLIYWTRTRSLCPKEITYVLRPAFSIYLLLHSSWSPLLLCYSRKPQLVYECWFPLPKAIVS